MAYEIRQALDYKFGQLSSSITALDTTVQSSAFTSLPSDLSTTKYVPVTIADDTAGLYEIVWVTGHSASSTSVTVVRGREGTTARAWSAGATWRIAPTSRDTLTAYTRATLPADAHQGMRAQLTDEGGLAVQRGADGWIGPLGSGAARKSAWTQSNSGIPLNSQTIISGLSAIAGFQSSPATYNAGTLLLNKPGFWYLWLGMFWDDGRSKYGSLQFTWPGGPLPANPHVRSYAPGGYSGAGQLNFNNSVLTYVTAAQATQPITVHATCMTGDASVITAGISYTLIAELLGG